MMLFMVSMQALSRTMICRCHLDVTRQDWDNEEVVTQMSVVPLYVQSADDLRGGHGCRPKTERVAAVLSEIW